MRLLHDWFCSRANPQLGGSKILLIFQISSHFSNFLFQNSTSQVVDISGRAKRYLEVGWDVTPRQADWEMISVGQNLAFDWRIPYSPVGIYNRYFPPRGSPTSIPVILSCTVCLSLIYIRVLYWFIFILIYIAIRVTDKEANSDHACVDSTSVQSKKY